MKCDDLPATREHGTVTLAATSGNVLRNMTKTLASLFSSICMMGARFMRFLEEQNDRQIALWCASLLRRRRYTHPEVAKRNRASHQ